MKLLPGAATAIACVLSLSASLPAAAAAAAAATTDSADAHFKAIYVKEWQWRVAQRMEDDEEDRKTVNARLPRVDARTQAERLAYWQGVLHELESVAVGKLSAAERIN